MTEQYPNVSRTEWSAMCRESEALQARVKSEQYRGNAAVAAKISERLVTLHKHMRAISNLIPTDGPPPR